MASKIGADAAFALTIRHKLVRSTPSVSPDSKAGEDGPGSYHRQFKLDFAKFGSFLRRFLTETGHSNFAATYKDQIR